MKRINRFLCYLVSLLSLVYFSVNSFADFFSGEIKTDDTPNYELNEVEIFYPIIDYDENSSQAEFDIVDNSDSDTINRFEINCVHEGIIGVDNSIENVVAVKITHRKLNILPCNEMMSWKIEWTIYNPNNGVVSDPYRPARTGQMAIGITNTEFFWGYSGWVFEFRVVTTVHGNTSQTDWYQYTIR